MAQPKYKQFIRIVPDEYTSSDPKKINNQIYIYADSIIHLRGSPYQKSIPNESSNKIDEFLPEIQKKSRFSNVKNKIKSKIFTSLAFRRINGLKLTKDNEKVKASV